MTTVDDIHLGDRVRVENCTTYVCREGRVNKVRGHVCGTITMLDCVGNEVRKCTVTIDNLPLASNGLPVDPEDLVVLK